MYSGSLKREYQLSEKVPIIFHDLRGYDSHLTFDELNIINVKIDIIPNKLEKYMAFFQTKT